MRVVAWLVRAEELVAIAEHRADDDGESQGNRGRHDTGEWTQSDQDYCGEPASGRRHQQPHVERLTSFRRVSRLTYLLCAGSLVVERIAGERLGAGCWRGRSVRCGHVV